MEFAKLRDSNLKTACVGAQRVLWDQRSRATGERWWENWYSWAIRSQLEPVKKVARMIKRHLSGVLS